MIILASDCLLFQLANGDSVPVTAETVSCELSDSMPDGPSPDMVHEATAAVFHYFKVELCREVVTVVEFAGALEKVLRGFGFQVNAVEEDPATRDLRELACVAGGELHFFAQLRTALRQQLGQSPHLIQFSGLRGCVKHLAGARRWSPRCEALRDQIVDYLRSCVRAEAEPADCTLLVQ